MSSVFTKKIMAASLGSVLLMTAAGASAAPHVYGHGGGYQLDSRAQQMFRAHQQEQSRQASQQAPGESFTVFAAGVTGENPDDLMADETASNGYWAGIGIPLFGNRGDRERVHLELGFVQVNATNVTMHTGGLTFEDGWNQGRDSGYQDGWSDGHGSGHGAGHEQGYGDGWEEGYEDGHEDGYGEGYGDGWNDGDNGDPNDPNYPGSPTPDAPDAPESPEAPEAEAPETPDAELPDTGDGQTVVRAVDRRAITAMIAYSYSIHSNNGLDTRLRIQAGGARVEGVTDEVVPVYGAGLELAMDRYSLRLGHDRYHNSENFNSVSYLGVGISF